LDKESLAEEISGRLLLKTLRMAMIIRAGQLWEDDLRRNGRSFADVANVPAAVMAKRRIECETEISRVIISARPLMQLRVASVIVTLI